MERLRLRTQQLITASLAVNTLSTYTNALHTFEHFRHQYSLPQLWPATADHIILFISHCFEVGYSPSTISTYIAGISFICKLNNWVDQTDLFLIKKLLEGCRRSRKRIDTRAPINPTMLREICLALPALCYTRYETSLFKAVYLLAYFGLFRVSELVFTSHLQPHRAVQDGDISFTKDATAVIITLKQSKTNQAGPPVVLRIPCEQDSELCPVRSLKEYVKVRPNCQGNFFCHSNGTPLTRSQFSGLLSKCIHSQSLNRGRFLTHSFRIGRATQLAAQGVDSAAIMKLGRWKSQVFRTYVRL